MDSFESLSHANFVKGIEDGSYGLVLRRSGYRLLSKNLSYVFIGLCLLYLIGPLVVIPALAYEHGNGWLLFGILACYVGCLSATGFRSIMAGATLFCVVFWFLAGFHTHHYVTFYYLCALSGYFLYSFASLF